MFDTGYTSRTLSHNCDMSPLAHVWTLLNFRVVLSYIYLYSGWINWLKKNIRKGQKMKISVAVIIALACVVGLALADYGSYGSSGYSYMPYYPSAKGSGGFGGFGDGGFLMLVGFLFLILLLFGLNGQDSISFVNVSR